MDNSEFLNLFWGLTNQNTDEQLVQSAESIVNLVESKQKLEKHEKKINNEKYKLYISIYPNPSEDLLYTIKRLVGGLASTGLESRRGFLLTFSLLLQKFSYSLNFSDLIQVIERESVVSKGEKGHVKNCILTGRILLLKSLLDIKNLSPENILTIFKQFVDLFSLKNLDEPLIQVTKIFLNRLLTGFYSDLTDKKRIFKFYDKFFNLFSKILVNKTNFGSIKNLHEFSLIFLFLSFSETSPVKDYFHTNVNENLLSDNSLLNFFKILLSQNVNENQSNTSLELFFNFLKVVNDQKLIFNIWNVLIETSIQDQLKQVSVKNYQFLIYSFSKFLLDNFFIFNYISQIFDSSFFEALLKFNSHKKFKYVNSLVELIMTKIKTLENKDETIKSYSIDMLKIFNTEGGLSTQSYKVFFTFLFNQLDESQKQDYIETLTKNQDEDSLTSRLTSLKQLMVGETELSKDLKDQILEYFFQLYFASESQNDIEFDDFIQDRLLVVILSYLKIPKDETQENKLKPLKDKKIIKLFVQIHKYLQNMITSNKIEDFEMSDYKIYSKYFKKFAVLISDSVKSSEKDKDLIEKKFSIIKIALIVLILFLKNPNEYSDIISDLYLVTKFKDDWQKVYIDILISLLHKGNNTLADFVMNSFRKLSRYLDMQSVEVLLNFLSQEEEEENFEDDGKIKGKKGGKSKKENGAVEMFEDLQDDVEMA